MRYQKTKNPRKQRKRIYEAPLHYKHRFFNVHLSKELREKYKTRTLPVRKGDIVRVKRGGYKKTEGKVAKILTSKVRLEIEGIAREKTGGVRSFYPVHPSNVELVRLGKIDKVRRKIIERRAKAEIPETELTTEEE